MRPERYSAAAVRSPCWGPLEDVFSGFVFLCGWFLLGIALWLRFMFHLCVCSSVDCSKMFYFAWAIKVLLAKHHMIEA